MPIKLIDPRPGKTPYFAGRGTHLGTYVDRSTKLRDERKARRLIRQWESDIERGVFARPGEPGFGAAALAYMKAGGEERPLVKLIAHFRDRALIEIDQAAIDAAAIELFPDAPPATRNREVYTPVSSVLKHAGHDFKLRRPKGSRGIVKTDWLWPEQAGPLLTAAEALDAEFALLCRLLLYTGCRISEALRLTCNDVRTGEAFAFVRTSKNGDPRPMFLPPHLVVDLENHPRGLERGQERVFRFHQGGALRYLLNAAKLIACGLPKPARVKHGKTPAAPDHALSFVTFHTFRHTYATWMRRYGGRDVKGLVGTGNWRSEQSASRYAHVVPSEDARAAALLPEIGRKAG